MPRSSISTMTFLPLRLIVNSGISSAAAFAVCSADTDDAIPARFTPDIHMNAATPAATIIVMWRRSFIARNMRSAATAQRTARFMS